jgi:hypothetical protein
VRVIIAALPDPDDETQYLLAVSKNNLVKASERPAIRYRIESSRMDADVPCITWGDMVAKSANAILADLAEAAKGRKVAEARMFLASFLASGEWMATKEIYAAAEAHGINKSAVERAKQKTLNLVAEKRDKGWGWRWTSGPQVPF